MANWGRRFVIGEDQLQRYKAFVREWYPGFEGVFVFFTLRNDEPTDSDYVPMRFSEFTPYLKKTLKALPHRDWADAGIVAVLLDHYRTLLSDRLSLRLKTRVELAPEMAKSCDGLFQREGALIPAILAGVRDWQESVREEMEAFIGELIARLFGKDCFSGDDCRHSADGGFLHRRREREIVPADLQDEFPRDRGHRAADGKPA